MHVDKVHNLSQSELNQKYWYLVVTLQSKIGGASIDSILLPKPPFWRCLQLNGAPPAVPMLYI